MLTHEKWHAEPQSRREIQKTYCAPALWVSASLREKHILRQPFASAPHRENYIVRQPFASLRLCENNILSASPLILRLCVKNILCASPLRRCDFARKYLDVSAIKLRKAINNSLLSRKPFNY